MLGVHDAATAGKRRLRPAEQYPGMYERVAIRIDETQATFLLTILLALMRKPDYHDHVGKSDDWVEQRRQELQRSGLTTTGGVKKKFPIQLHQMLEAIDGTEHSRIVHWLPHGRAFAVLDKKRLESDLLPAYFPQQSSYASFQRQLNIYGFWRLTRDGDGYYHEFFLRTRSTMAALIPRSDLGRHSIRVSYDSASEPDLYALAWLPDVVSQADGGVPSITARPEDSSKTVLVAPPPVLGRTVPPSSQMALWPMRTKVARQGRVTSGLDETVGDICMRQQQQWPHPDVVDQYRAFPESSVRNESQAVHENDRAWLSTNFHPLSVKHPESNEAKVSTAQLFAQPQHGQKSDASTWLGSTSRELLHPEASLLPTYASLRQDLADAERNSSITGWSDEKLSFFGSSSSEKSDRKSGTETVSSNEDEIEAICQESQSQVQASKLCEWANFLRDIDFDASSSNGTE
jgi:HSF-type DNA-binding